MNDEHQYIVEALNGVLEAHPVFKPQGTGFPCVVFTLLTSTEVDSLDGKLVMGAEYRFDFMAETIASLNKAYDEAIAALLNGGRAAAGSPYQLYEDDVLEGIYRQICTVEIE